MKRPFQILRSGTILASYEHDTDVYAATRADQQELFRRMKCAWYITPFQVYRDMNAYHAVVHLTDNFGLAIGCFGRKGWTTLHQHVQNAWPLVYVMSDDATPNPHDEPYKCLLKQGICLALREESAYYFHRYRLGYATTSYDSSMCLRNVDFNALF